MAEQRKTLESGVELVIQVGSWEESHRLYKAVMSVMATTSFQNDEIISLIAKLSISGEVEAALWVCMGRCTYKGVKITKSIFEDETAREDYLVIAREVMVYNLRPFLKSLTSLFPKLPGLGAISNQK